MIWYKRAITESEKGDVHGRIDRDGIQMSIRSVAICLRMLKKYEEAATWEARAFR